jgi:hypothetical protein
MTRIVPGQVVETIDRLFTGESKGVGTAQLTHERLFHLQGIVDLLRQLPSELLAVSAAEFADLTVATAAIELTILRCSHGQWPIALPPISGEDVIHTIRRVLDKCADEAPLPGTAELSFIADQQFRESMRLEIGAVNSALQNAEWKAATVLGGAAIEALLHWKLSELQTTGADIMMAKAKAVSSGRLQNPPTTKLDRWVLSEFIAVARELDVIDERTFKQSDTARNYRNLIHPGYASRSGQACNRATALAVVSSLEHVIGDLGRS